MMASIRSKMDKERARERERKSEREREREMATLCRVTPTTAILSVATLGMALHFCFLFGFG